MTYRYNTLTVVLEKDIREDDAEVTLAAIRQLRGVLDVTGNVANAEAYMAEARAKADLGSKIFAAIYPERYGLGGSK